MEKEKPIIGKEKPSKAFSVGPIQVAVFMNKRQVRGQLANIPSVSFRKRYLGEGDEWKSTNSLDTNDVPKAILALTKAYDYLVGLKVPGGVQGGSEEEAAVD